jgi:3-oxoacyl-[acyl-carrier protein] reductase
MFDLSGRRALVTGASGGIGQVVAKRLHERGAQVVVTGTRTDVLDEVARAVGGSTLAIPADLATEAGVASLVASIDEMLGGVDILIANAGISRRTPLEDTATAEWRDVMEVNLSSVFTLTRAVAPAMARRGWGRVIAIGSILGTTGAAGMGPYAASKAGLAGLMKAVALEFADRGVTANTIAPGYIRTKMMDMNPPEVIAGILSRIPVGFFGSPDDVAACVLWLAGQSGRFVTGATIDLNGGMVMP